MWPLAAPWVSSQRGVYIPRASIPTEKEPSGGHIAFDDRALEATVLLPPQSIQGTNILQDQGAKT